MKESIDPVPIEDILNALKDINHPFPSHFLPYFSDISEANLAEIIRIWEQLAVKRKVNLLADLERAMEGDTLLAFDDIARFALKDNDPNVRRKAIELLWESEDSGLAVEFSDLLKHDPDETVQLSAAEALGRFVLLGELDEIPSRIAKEVREVLLHVLSIHPTKKIQQEIIKSLSYANLPEIGKEIDARFKDPDPTWQLAAIISMGRSANERWEESILKMLKNPSLPHQIEAVRSAGELELASARQILLEMLNNNIQDEDLRYQAIWSLAKIGGDEVRETLEKILEDTDSDDEADIIELALEHLSFSDELPSLDIF